MQLIDRTIEVLLLLSNEPNGLSVTQLASELDISNSSAHRILQSLKKHYFVLQSSETKRYRLGYKVLSLTTNITKANNLTFAAKPYMQALAKEVEETVALSVLEGADLVCLDYVEGPNISRLMVNPGVAMPAHATSGGKVILAYRPIDEIRSIYDLNEQEKVTSNTLDNYEDFVGELAKVSEQGYAISDEELQLGVQGVAVPIFDYNHKVIGSLSITALKSSNKLSEHNINRLKSCAEEITVSIGGLVID